MEHRTIGSLSVSVIGFGCTTIGRELDARQSAEVVGAAMDAGITFFDTAEAYGSPRGASEEYLGRALGTRRDEVIVATKFGSRLDGDGNQQPLGATPSAIRESVEASLRRLQTDRIDLYQLHRPDPVTPIAETLEALNGLVTSGKVREIGCSNFSAQQLREAAATGRPAFVSVQNEYNLLHRDDEASVIPGCEELGISYLPWYPLANGLLTGKYRKGSDAPPGARLTVMPERRSAFINERNLDVVERLAAYAEMRGHTMLELAYGWLLSLERVPSIIVGTRTSEQVSSNVAGTGWRLNEEERAEIDALAPRPDAVSEGESRG